LKSFDEFRSVCDEKTAVNRDKNRPSPLLLYVGEGPLPDICLLEQTLFLTFFCKHGY